MLGALPTIAAGVGLRAELLLARRWAASFDVALSPEQREGAWSFGLTRFAAGACFRAHLHRRVELTPCVGLSFGLVHVVTFGPEPVEPGNYAWLSLHTDGRVTVRVAGPVVAQLALGAAWVPLRQRFVTVGPTGAVARTVFEQSAFAGWGTAGAGAEW